MLVNIQINFFFLIRNKINFFLIKNKINFLNKSFHVRTIQVKISVRLTPQVTIIIYYHMKKVLLNKRKKKENTKNTGQDQNSYVNKNDT